jgi:hypothetical protein
MDGKPLILGLIVLLSLWNVFVATHMETPYPETMVELYALPFTRLLLLLVVIALSMWDAQITILAALAFICLGADVIFLTK